MASGLEQDTLQELQQAHQLLERLTPAKLVVVRALLEVMINDDEDDELTEQDRVAIQAGLDSLEKNGSIPMENILAEFGMLTAG